MRKSREVALLVLIAAACASCGTSSDTGSDDAEEADTGSHSQPAQEADYLPVDQRSITGGIPSVTAAGTSIPVLVADWSALGGSQILPPESLEWTRVAGDPVVLSIAASATPLDVELNGFESVSGAGIPAEESMEYTPCIRIKPDMAGGGAESPCTFRMVDDHVEVTIQRPPKYMVVSSTWYPNLGSDELNASQKVAASWALATG